MDTRPNLAGVTGLNLLNPMVGKTWKSTFSDPRGTPVTDVCRWERALNGKAVKSLHSLDQGVYGGETYFLAGPSGEVEYHYFTTEGFRTQGTLREDQGNLVTLEVVSGNASGIEQVRGTTVFLGADSYRVSTEYLQNGAWRAGRVADYVRDDTAVVKLP